MKKHNKKIRFLEAVLVIAIAVTFVMPGVAAVTNPHTSVQKKIMPRPVIGSNTGWIEQASGFLTPSRGISDMHAVDANVVWAAGYDGIDPNAACQDFTRTTNGGDLWTPGGVTGAIGLSFSMIVAVDADHAWAAMYDVSGGTQGIYNTTDGGATWNRQSSAAFSGSGAFPNTVHFWDQNVGWCMGDPVDGYFEIYTTNDGGATWTRVPQADIPAPLSGEMGTVGYYDVVDDTVWFGTQAGGRVFKSTDRGHHWTVADSQLGSSAYVDIRFKDANHGLAMDKNFENAVLTETSDGGATWSPLSYTGTCYAADFDYVPGTDNMYVSTGVNSNDPSFQGASYSFDGGHTWTVWEEMQGIQLFGTTWVAGKIGWAGSFNTDATTGGVWKYVPGGQEPFLIIESITGGNNITIAVKNIGDGDATGVQYTIDITGGFIIKPRTADGDLDTLTPGESKAATMNVKGIGLGLLFPIPTIQVTATCTEGKSAEQIVTAKIFFSKVTIQ